MWTLDQTSITLDNTSVHLDGAISGDVTVPGQGRPNVITQVKQVRQRGKIESALLVVIAVAAYSGSTDVRAAPKQTFVDAMVFDAPWKGSPLVSVLTAYPADVVVGFDNFVGYGQPEPPFIQPQRAYLTTVLQSYAAFDPATDVTGGAFRRRPFFEDRLPFIKEQLRSLINLTINPAPTGDITTLYRKQQWFDAAKSVDTKNPGAWHIVLLPDIGPIPPPPPPPPGPYWPQPSSITNLPVRGAWEIPGGKQAVWVIGSGAFLMTVSSQATGSAQASFVLKRIGTLLTSTGPVCIRDNGAGGTVVIVDGPNGYYYTFSSVGGTIGKFTKITDPAFLGADRVAFIDGWWVFNQPGTQVFYTPSSTYSLTFNGTNFALKDGATDLLVTLYENKEELWLVGERTTEVWYDAGGQYFAFQRLVSTMLQVGCSAKHSIARFNANDEDGLVWLGKSERGQNVVIMVSGFTATVISTPAINDAIASYTKIDDAIGYTYQEDGHEFYVLTFPSAVNEYNGQGMTWVYDGSTVLWHQRLSYEPYGQSWNRHRSNCFLNFQDQRLVGDYQNGSIYNMTREAYTDAGWPLVAWRRAPHIWDGGARERVFMAFLQLDFRPGVGNPSGQGVDPQAILTISRDGGTTWGQQISRGLGKIGQYLNRVIWRRLSFSRDAVIDVKVYDDVNRDIVGATLKKGEKDG